MRVDLTLSAAIAAVVVMTVAGAAAQGSIATAKALRCSFQRQATGTWKKDGIPDAAAGPAALVLRFESIDTDGGTAELKTGSVGSEVTVRSVEGYLHFMQAFRTGPLYTTTVFAAGSVGGTFRAVHSRHEYFLVPLPGATSSPEQYYGACEIVG
jgi:hypothetical protein